MPNWKVSVIGAGKVGESTAFISAVRNIADIVLIDIVEGLAEGKALDIAESAGVLGFSSKIIGTTDWHRAQDSDIVIVTSGMPRKPGMSRDDLLSNNVKIVKNVSENIKRHCPSAFVIVVCNPLDAMVYTASKITGFEHSRVMGMAGALDTARFNHFVSLETGADIADIHSLLLGGHGDSMVPLPDYCTVKGIPLRQMLGENEIEKIVERTRHGGIEIVNLLGTSAYYAPAAGAAKMAESILFDKKEIFCCCAYCDNQYSVGGAYIGVPAVLGEKGVENIIEVKLAPEQKTALQTSAEQVRKLTAQVDKLI